MLDNDKMPKKPEVPSASSSPSAQPKEQLKQAGSQPQEHHSTVARTGKIPASTSWAGSNFSENFIG